MCERQATLHITSVSIHIRHCWRMNLSWERIGHQVRAVSIHIRHCWRMNILTTSTGSGGGSFNPHSPLLANESTLRFACAFTIIVSIHIRHCWRMNPPAHRSCAFSQRRFNPHSPLLANESPTRRRCLRPAGFNPHSPLLANESVLGQPAPCSVPCFNPHSPLLANE